MRKSEQLEMFDDGDRRERAQSQHPGRRVTDGPAPLGTRDCADFLGKGLDFVYELISSGTLRATYVQLPGKKRGTWVITQEDFITCLKALKWTRLPTIR